MGYESKVMIVREYGTDDFTFASVVAVFDMSKMGYYTGWTELFTRETDGIYPIITADYCDLDEKIRTDKYGDTIKSASLTDVLDWCKNNEDYYADYLPFRVLYGAVKEISKSADSDYWVYHYGY